MRRIILIVLLILMSAGSALAGEVKVPTRLQLALFLKILPFDRNLKQRAGSEIVVGIIYQKSSEQSMTAKEELLGAIEEASVKKIDGIPIRFVPIDIGTNDLSESVAKIGVDVLYVTPIGGAELKTITGISHARKLMTMAAVPDYVASGLTVGVGTKDEKPSLIINLSAAKAEGVDFSSQLLKLARLVG